LADTSGGAEPFDSAELFEGHQIDV
jgi:hypothetical protein